MKNSLGRRQGGLGGPQPPPQPKKRERGERRGREKEREQRKENQNRKKVEQVIPRTCGHRPLADPRQPPDF